MSQPWARVRHLVEVPANVTSEDLLALDDHTFGELLRGWLLAPPGRQPQWKHLWRVLSDDEDCADRTLTLLDEWIDQAEAAADDPELDPAQQKRARKFAVHALSAFNRVNNIADPDSPLGWAGRAGRGINHRGASIINVLVRGIADHRAAVVRSGQPRVADEPLWELLRRLRLDPDRRQQQRN